MKIQFTPTKTLKEITENNYRSKNNDKDYWDYRYEIQATLWERNEREAEKRQSLLLEAYNNEVPF